MSKKHGLLEATIAFGTLGAFFVYSKLRNLIIGNPPSKIRQAIFTTALGTFLIYQVAGNKIDSYVSHIDSALNNPVRVEKQMLEDSLKTKNNILYNQKDILDNQKKQIDSLSSLTSALYGGTYKKTNELEKKLSEIEKNNNFLLRTTAELGVKSRDTVTIIKEIHYLEKNEPKKTEKNNSEYKISSAKTLQVNHANKKTLDGSGYWYVVQPGESLSVIADKFYGSQDLYKAIAEYNGIEKPSLMEAGMPLKLPKENLKKSNGLRMDMFPKNYFILGKNESITDAIKKSLGVSGQYAKLAEEKITEYNLKKDNKFYDSAHRNLQRVIVYLPEGMGGK